MNLSIAQSILVISEEISEFQLNQYSIEITHDMRYGVSIEIRYISLPAEDYINLSEGLLALLSMASSMLLHTSVTKGILTIR